MKYTHLPEVQQPEVRLVHQRRRLQRVARALMPHVAPRQSAQLMREKRRIGPRLIAPAARPIETGRAAVLPVLRSAQPRDDG